MSQELVTTQNLLPTKAIVTIGPFQFHKHKLIANGEPDFTTWNAVAERMQQVNEYSTEWMALLLVWGEQHYGEKYAQATKATGKEYSTLANAVHTVKTIEADEWRDELDFTHFQELANLQAKDERVVIRDNAIDHGWTCFQVRSEVQRLKGKHPPFIGEVTIINGENDGEYIMCPGYGVNEDDIPTGTVKAVLRGVSD
jgi:hypothetical protein